MTPPPVDFSLRPNKAVERKLIFEALSNLSTTCAWPQYQYIGLGALWFRDFLLAHRLLGISSMHSIEGSQNIALRAEVSRPLRCIKVHLGKASQVLLSSDLRITERKSVVWLDYFDTATAETIGDVERLCRDLPLGSVLLVTLNAAPKSWGSNSDEIETKLRALFGAWVPPSPPPEYFTAALEAFPRHLSELVWARALGTARASGRGICALFNFAYRDGAPMITVGGVLADAEMERAIKLSGVRKRLGVLRTGRVGMSAGWPRLLEQHRIQVPVLTRLERMRLNRELPGKLGVKKVRKLCGHELRQGERDAYAAYFSHYPTFAEIDL